MALKEHRVRWRQQEAAERGLTRLKLQLKFAALSARRSRCTTPRPRPAEMVGEYLTAAQAATYLGVSVAAIRKWTYRRRVAVMKMGRLARYKKADLDRLARVRRPLKEGPT